MITLQKHAFAIEAGRYARAQVEAGELIGLSGGTMSASGSESLSDIVADVLLILRAIARAIEARAAYAATIRPGVRLGHDHAPRAAQLASDKLARLASEYARWSTLLSSAHEAALEPANDGESA